VSFNLLNGFLID